MEFGLKLVHLVDFSCHAVPIFFRAKIFRAVPAKISRAMIFRAGQCHKSPGPPVRAVPERPCYDLA